MKEKDQYKSGPTCQFMNVVEFLCMQLCQIANGVFLPIACYKFFIWKLNREGELSL